jgi:hypothetical protein
LFKQSQIFEFCDAEVAEDLWSLKGF